MVGGWGGVSVRWGIFSKLRNLQNIDLLIIYAMITKERSEDNSKVSNLSDLKDGIPLN